MHHTSFEPAQWNRRTAHNVCSGGAAPVGCAMGVCAAGGSHWSCQIAPPTMSSPGSEGSESRPSPSPEMATLETMSYPDQALLGPTEARGKKGERQTGLERKRENDEHGCKTRLAWRQCTQHKRWWRRKVPALTQLAARGYTIETPLYPRSCLIDTFSTDRYGGP